MPSLYRSSYPGAKPQPTAAVADAVVVELSHFGRAAAWYGGSRVDGGFRWDVRRGIVEARHELRRTGRWIEPLPRARIRRRKR